MPFGGRLLLLIRLVIKKAFSRLGEFNASGDGCCMYGFRHWPAVGACNILKRKGKKNTIRIISIVETSTRYA
ncbi:hypothetical protein F5X97DRAFT_67382 [Nemania serpens]|nr:hypothetical protein F5X97DRAFT_67382 [Nemania serpens]